MLPDRNTASATRSTRSVSVLTIKARIISAPRRMPSAASFTDTTK